MRIDTPMRGDSSVAQRPRLPCCQQCGDALVAPAQSVHVDDNDVRHWWSCDNCGYEFMTSVRISLIGHSRARFS